MSLVNDMLRDLDARRQGAPGKGIGSAKLKPAPDDDRRGEDGPRRPVMLWISLGVLAIALVVAAVTWLTAGSQPELAPRQPVAVVAPQVDPAAARQERVQQQELERITQRLQALEQENRELRETVVSRDVEAPAPVVAEAREERVTEMAPRWQPSEPEVSRPVLQIAEAPTTEAPTVEPSPVGETIRTPRELSFRDTDRQRVQQALAIWRDNRQQQAIQMLDDFVQNNPEAHQSREMLAKFLMQSGDTQTAMYVVMNGMAIAPDHAGYKKVQARLLLDAGQPADAALLLSSRPPRVGADTEYHELLGTALLFSQEFEDALFTYRSLLEQDAERAAWWYGHGAALDGMGRSFEAAQSYERALQLGDLSGSLRRVSQERLVAIRQG